MALAPTVQLRSGAQLPLLGLGTWPLNDHDAADTVSLAIEIGYRLIDTAENYRNEQGVGEGIRRSDIRREELFITTKFNRGHHTRDGVRRAFQESTRRLGLDYVDLLLVHWPNPDQGRHVEAVQGIATLMEEGLVRAVGTSNYKPAHLQQVIDAGIVPDVNQIQLDPQRPRIEERAFHGEHCIVTESWSPLGQGTGCSTNRVSSRSPGPMAGRPRRWCCAGTSSRAWSPFRSRRTRNGWHRTSASSTSNSRARNSHASTRWRRTTRTSSIRTSSATEAAASATAPERLDTATGRREGNKRA